MIIANFGPIGKPALKTGTNRPTTTIREHHVPNRSFVVYDGRPRTPLTCG
jgi:hypothetical protein